MIKYDMEVNEQNIIDSIKNDYLKRNKKLSKLIQLIVTLQGNNVISIDGNWGTGKTIFVKQLEIINQKQISFDCFSENLINDYRSNYIVHYYNAWENDIHNSALLSLIYNLINYFPNLKSQSVNGKIKIPLDIKNFLKTISKNAIDIDRVESYEDMAKEIYTIEERRESLNSLLNDIIPKDKKLIFIIDELDRCKPDFAVNLIETLKHYFNNEKIIFIISTNNEQLSHTIKKYYGNDFDGYGYLNKFFDLIIELNECDFETYLSRKFNINKNSQYYITALFETIDYFKLNMREINRLLNDFKILEAYFTTSYGMYYEDNIAKYIFLPYCLALKIKDRYKLTKFLNGTGFDELISFIMNEEKMRRIIEKEIINRNNPEVINEEEVKNFALKRYNRYFNDDKTDEEFNLDFNKEMFLDIFSLLSDDAKYDS